MELRVKKSAQIGFLGIAKSVQNVLLHGMVAIAAIGAVIAIQQEQLKKPPLWVTSPQQEEQQETLRLNALMKTPSFGFDNLMADWAFLNFVQYYGDDDARKQTGYGLSPQYFDLVTKHDPRFADSYLFLSGAVSHQLGQPETALQLMQRGKDALSPQAHPKAFAVWRFSALDRMLLLNDVPGTIHDLEMAAQWSGATEEFRGLAPVFKGTAEYLKTNPDSRLVRFQAWSAVYLQALALRDRKTQDRAKREIIALGGVERVNEKGEKYFALPTDQLKSDTTQSESDQPEAK